MYRFMSHLPLSHQAGGVEEIAELQDETDRLGFGERLVRAGTPDLQRVRYEVFGDPHGTLV
jgi:hypothetical protein